MILADVPIKMTYLSVSLTDVSANLVDVSINLVDVSMPILDVSVSLRMCVFDVFLKGWTITSKEKFY